MVNAVGTLVTLSANDYDAIRELWQLAGLSIRPVGRDSREQFAAQLAGGLQTAIGMQDGQRLIGVVVTTHDGRKGWINRLAVHPEYRRQGIGRRLIQEAEQVLHSQGMHIIAALIEHENAASLALFQQVGYADYAGIHYVTKRESDSV
jgi:ribosomal protein S18 acetylase RimI-like enzyme